MDYEKKYKEALERAREIKSKILSSHLSTESCKAVSEYIDTIIPELAGSEDERIRKWLIGIVNGCKELNFKDKVKLTRYIEKQKEQKDYRKLYDDIAKSDWFKKAYVGKSLGTDDEQKPAEWSEEDEKIMNEISIIMGGGKVTSGTYLSEYVAWLKSLPERFNLQPKPEWSEEDEIMLNAAIEMVENSNTVFCHEVNNCKVSSWLKSLRPPLKDKEMKLKILKYLSTRCSSLEFEEVEDYLNNLRPSWKPSEEQMEALDKALYYVPEEIGIPIAEIYGHFNKMKKKLK